MNLRRAALTALGLTAATLPALTPVAPAAGAGERVAPSGTLRAVALRPPAEPFTGLRRAMAWPVRSPRPELLAERKELLDAAAPSGPPPRRKSAAPRTVSGLNQPGLVDPSGSPPDTTGAIGPLHYVEIVNSQVGVFDRGNLGLVAQTSLASFVADPTAICDPQIQWDPAAARWFYVALNCTGTPGADALYVGWSKTPDPRDLTAAGWCRFKVATGTTTQDYPKLGHDADHLIIGTNAFNGATALGARILVTAKPPAGTSCPGSLTFTTFGGGVDPLLGSDGLLVNTPVPDNRADATGTGFVLAADDATSGEKSHIVVWRIDGTGAAPVLTRVGAVTVPTYSLPASVPQPTVGTTLDTLDGRLTQAVGGTDSAAGAQAVWTQHTVSAPGTSGRAIVRWYEILPTIPALRQAGTIDVPGVFAFNAAISPTTASTPGAVITYNVASGGQLVDIRTQSRNPDMPLGTMGGEVLLGTSDALDADFTCTSPPTPCRWGDYAGASPDPVDPNAVWGSNQLNGPVNGTTPAWRTRNFSIQASRPPTAAFAVDRASILSGDPVTFTSTASDPDGPLTSLAWDLGSGSFSDASGPTATRAFPRPGTYTIRLRATDADGVARDAAQTIAVTNRPPVPGFTVKSSPAKPGRLVRFSGSGSRDPDGTIVRYEWDLDGNGTFERSATKASASKRYPFPDLVAVRLRLTDDSGATAISTARVRVRDSATVSRAARDGLIGSLRATSASLRSVLAKGYAVQIRISRRGRARVTLTLDAATARALGVPRTLARKSVRFSRSGLRTVRLRIVGRARALLLGRHGFRVTAAATVTDGRGTVRLRRRVLMR